MKKSFLLGVLGVGSILTLGGVKPWSSPGIAAQDCSSATQVAGSSRVDVKGEGDTRSVQFSMSLRADSAPIGIRPIVFVGDRQIKNIEPMHLKCGESMTRVIESTEFDRVNTVHVFRAEDPMIPESVMKDRTDESVNSTYYLPFDYNVFFLNPKMAATSAPVDPTIRFRWVSVDQYTTDTGSHVRINHTEQAFVELPVGSSAKFQVVFNPNIATGQPKRAVAVTCMLDEEQFAGFGEAAPSWSGVLEAQRMVVIEGRTEPLKAGFHLLRCVVLSDIYATKETMKFVPETIRPVVFYVR